MTGPPRGADPPRWVVRLLAELAPYGESDPILGDLEEGHRRRVAASGPRRAAWGTAVEGVEMALALVRVGVQRRRTEGRWPPMGTLENWIADFRHAARALLRAPAFTAVVVVTLALAVGANTAIYSVVDNVLLDALPFRNADRLVALRGTSPGSDLPDEFGVPDEMYVAYRAEADLLEDAGMYSGMQATMRADDNVERLFMGRFTPSVFSTLEVSPVLGRLPTEEDGEDVVVLSHWLWSAWFGSDPGVLGRSYEVAGASRTVLGVMGPEFRFPDERIALWVPWILDLSELSAGGFGAEVVARLVPGAAPEALLAQLEPIARTMPERYGGPPLYARIMENHRAIVRPLKEHVVGDISGALWVLMGTVGVVLLIACANVANLFIARGESRRGDLAVRHALGAGRSGLLRIQMAEAVVLALAGGVLGSLVAWLGVPLLVSIAPEDVPRLASSRLDLGALAFAAAASLVAAVVFGLLPAFRFSRPTLVSGQRGAVGTGGAAASRSRDALVVVQTASAFVLLVGAGLLFRSFVELSRVDPGYDTDDIFTFQIAPTGEELNDGPSYARFHHRFMDRIAGLPGVQSVGVVNTLPLDEGAGSTVFQTERTEAGQMDEPLLRMTMTGGDYFETMGIDLVAGREFDRADSENGIAEAIVGTATAELLWPGQDPIGQRLRPRGAPMWWTVIGVTEDVFLQDFRQPSAEPLVYFPLVGPVPTLYAVGSPAYVVKSPRAEVIADDIRSLVREDAPDSPMYRIFTMRGLAARSMAELSFTLLTLAVASGLALILGAVGLYGVLSYVVSRRTREIGVRMALGARADQVRRMVMIQGSRVALLGLAVGVASALALTRVLGSLLFGVEPLDVPTFLATSAIMLAIALLACYLPARRASGVDPMRSLRVE